MPPWPIRALLWIKKNSFNVYLFSCLCYLERENLFDIISTEGYSMHPLIGPNQVLLTEHYSVDKRDICQDDIVIFKSPEDPTKYFCKRVVALEGEWLGNKRVPFGYVWVEGDNKENSNDSRNFGPVPLGLLTNRVLLTVCNA